MSEPGPDSDLLDLLGEAARCNEICPTTVRLARQLGVAVLDIQLAFDRLRQARLIDWTVHHFGKAHGRVRVVTLLPGGEQTRLPESGKRERRRRGCIVFDAELRDGRKGRGLVRVDHRRLKRDAVIALAGMAAP